MPGKKYKLLLINPKTQMIKAGIEFNLHTIYEPLGLAIVAALTPDHWDVEIMDENFEEIVFKQVDLVGLTSFTSNANRAYEIAKIYRERGVTTVLGGIHASMIPEDAEPFVDTIVIGEAEGVWHNVIADFETGVLKKRYQAELPMEYISPKPRRDLIKPDYIYASVQTTRGCPMDCDFCSVSIFNGKKYRLRPVDDILEELESIRNRRIFFVDDNIVGHSRATKQHAKDLFRGMIDRRLSKEWFSQAGMNIADDKELVKLAAKSGCRMLLLGIETEKEEDLEDMHKSLNLKIGVQKYRHIFRVLHQQGISILGAFIFGLESDTVADLYKRFDYIARSEVDAIQATILTPYPGTRVYEKMVQQNRLIKNSFPEDWNHYHMFETVFKPNRMTFDELALNMTLIWKKLYDNSRLRKGLIKTFYKCWNLNPVKWARRGLNAALWGFYTNHLTYKKVVEQYYIKEKRQKKD